MQCKLALSPSPELAEVADCMQMCPACLHLQAAATRSESTDKTISTGLSRQLVAGNQAACMSSSCDVHAGCKQCVLAWLQEREAGMGHAEAASQQTLTADEIAQGCKLDSFIGMRVKRWWPEVRSPDPSHF